MARRKENKIFENIEIMDAGAKGKAIGFAADGKVIFINNAVPGDICSIQITKKRKF